MCQGSEAQIIALQTLVQLSAHEVATHMIVAKGLPVLHALISLPQLLGIYMNTFKYIYVYVFIYIHVYTYINT